MDNKREVILDTLDEVIADIKSGKIVVRDVENIDKLKEIERLV